MQQCEIIGDNWGITFQAVGASPVIPNSTRKGTDGKRRHNFSGLALLARQDTTVLWYSPSIEPGIRIQSGIPMGHVYGKKPMGIVGV